MKFNNAKLRGLLAETGMRTETFAKKLGVKASTVRAWKAGNRSPLRYIDKIAKIFNVNYTIFFKEETNGN